MVKDWVQKLHSLGSYLHSLACVSSVERRGWGLPCRLRVRTRCLRVICQHSSGAPYGPLPSEFLSSAYL